MNSKNVIINKKYLSINADRIKESIAMNTFQLSCFLAVSETLNFAKAAELLSITQPAVTHQIRSLETELNTKLFKRTTRTVELTHEGSLFINDARSMINIARRAKQRFSSPSEENIKVFSVGSHNHSHLFMLSDTLKEMAREHSGLHPQLKVVPFQFLYRLLEEEDVDVIIGFKETDMKAAPYIYKELAKVPFVCICSRDKAASELSVASPEMLKNERMILFRPPGTSSVVNQVQRQFAGERPLSDIFFCESVEESIVLVQAGLGIAVMPDLYLPPEYPLARIPLEKTEPASFGACYKTLKGNPLLKSFLSAADRIIVSHDI